MRKPKMKWILLVFLAATLSSCGSSTADGIMVGQVRRLTRKTPWICPNYYNADIYIDGKGSTEYNEEKWERVHKWVSITDKATYEKFRSALQTGKLLTVSYDVRSFGFCTNTAVVTNVEPYAPQPSDFTEARPMPR